MSCPSTPFSSYADMDASPTPPITNITDSPLNSTTTDKLHSPVTHPLTRSRKALEKKEDNSKPKSRKRKHWQCLADDPANHVPDQAKPNPKKGKKRDRTQPQGKKGASLSPQRDDPNRQKGDDEQHRPYYEEEDEELWKHFDEPEWQGILDVVP